MTGTLQDRADIADIIAAYAHAIDRRRWSMMERLFHENAQFQFGTVAGDWRGFVEQARAIIDPCLATQHQLGQVQFGFAKGPDGESICHTETYMTAMHTIPAGYPIPDVFPDKGKIYSAVIAGRYVDRFEKRDGEWRIAHRTGLYDWREFREVEGVDLSQMPEGSCGYHDERDPSTPVVARWLG
ncbi:nuclear transport factor 2 family protein [uncultured Erythrobacter sp.]|uniref:nuclear transport factor 2 family protein n=1 Tax=uncultured Erythrobacter sp. TaxID=263913 RepID=UPI0026235E12|nr:nuclear transport factor 2 family protein [uncultured Erythrobacter sp.]